jgi:predicted metal-dependent hydrolase
VSRGGERATAVGSPGAGLSPDELALLERGLGQFDARLFFECHDTLEELWSGLRGEARSPVQGLIQLAVGFYHLGNGNRVGAARLLERGLARLASCPDTTLGVDLAALRRSLAPWRAALAGAGPLPEAGPPAIPRSGKPAPQAGGSRL